MEWRCSLAALPFAALVTGFDVQANAFVLAERGDQLREVIRPRIALFAEHPHQACRLLVDELAKFLKADRRVHVVAEESFPRRNIAVEKALGRLGQEADAEFRIPRGSFFYGFHKTSGECHRL